MLFQPFKTVLGLLALAAAVLAPLAAGAQISGRTGLPLVDEQRVVLEGYSKKTDELQREMLAEAEDDVRLVDIRLELEGISRSLLTSAVAFRPRLSEINARLEQLGAPPAPNAPVEPDIVTGERDALTAEKAEINAVLGYAESLSLRVNGLIEQIATLRRDLFQNLLTKRYDINYKLVGEVLAAASAETSKLYRTISSWLRFVIQFKLNSVLAAALCAVLAATVLTIGGRRLFGRLFEADPSATDPDYLSRLSVAFWSTLLPAAALQAFLATTYFLFDYFAVLRGDIGSMLLALFSVVGVVFFIHRLAKAILSPRLPHWRLVQVETRAAWQLVALISATAFFTGLDYFLSSVFDTLGSPLALTVGQTLAATVLTGILVVLVGLIRPFADGEGRSLPWPPSIRVLLPALGLLTLIAALFGYIGFARFLSRQIVVTGAILAMMYIGLLSARAISEEGAFAQTGLGRRMERWFKLDAQALDQVGLVVSIAINLLMVLCGVPLILLQWGFQPGDLWAWVYTVATGFRVGSITFSLTGILSGILVFVIGYFATRWFQGWLDGSVMARGRVDAGVRNSIRLAVGYAGVALAALVGISAAGIDLSNLALVAGALSLGIGFGLQNVVSNFVSGLILLAERPFKVGDWIVAGQVSGTVKKISVRATEIETFQRQSVILPNSDLINSAVGNWTHRNKTGRVDIRVGIAYGDDVRRAHEVLLDIARSHPLVLKNPEPFVLFSNFGSAALEFEIRVFLADVTNGNTVQNDIRFGILEAFAREGIEIPSTPRYKEDQPAKEKWPTDDDKAEVEHAAQRSAEQARTEEAEAQRKGRRRKKPDPD